MYIDDYILIHGLMLNNYFENLALILTIAVNIICTNFLHFGYNTRDVFYVRRRVDLKKTAKVNAYIMHIFGKIELLSIHAT